MGILDFFFGSDEEDKNNKTNKTQKTSEIQKPEAKVSKPQPKTKKEAKKEEFNQEFNDAEWLMKHFIDVSTYLDWSKSILGMICVKLGGIPLEHYKYSGFLVDIIKYLIFIGKELKKNKDAEALISAKFKGGIKGLENMLKVLEDEAIAYSVTKNEDIEETTMDENISTIPGETKISFAEKLGGLAHGEGKTPPDSPPDDL